MKTIYLTFNQQARLYGWLQNQRKQCIYVTRKDPVVFIAKPITNQDLGPLPYTHAEFPDDVQWWLEKRCPYPFVKAGKGKSPLINRLRYWIFYKLRKNK